MADLLCFGSFVAVALVAVVYGVWLLFQRQVALRQVAELRAARLESYVAQSCAARGVRLVALRLNDDDPVSPLLIVEIPEKAEALSVADPIREVEG